MAMSAFLPLHVPAINKKDNAAGGRRGFSCICVTRPLRRQKMQNAMETDHPGEQEGQGEWFCQMGFSTVLSGKGGMPFFRQRQLCPPVLLSTPVREAWARKTWHWCCQICVCLAEGQTEQPMWMMYIFILS
jgi:hypothetical protein